MDEEIVAEIIASARGMSLDEKRRFYSNCAARIAWGPLTYGEMVLNRHLLRMVDGVRWYHGGVAGRKPGDILLPPRVTGADPRGHGDEYPDRAEWVYITRSPAVARVYRGWVPNGEGAAYEVEPLGPVQVDPADLRKLILLQRDPEVSEDAVVEAAVVLSGHCCQSARVVAVIDTRQGQFCCLDGPVMR